MPNDLKHKAIDGVEIFSCHVGTVRIFRHTSNIRKMSTIEKKKGQELVKNNIYILKINTYYENDSSIFFT